MSPDRRGSGPRAPHGGRRAWPAEALRADHALPCGLPFVALRRSAHPNHRPGAVGATSLTAKASRAWSAPGRLIEGPTLQTRCPGLFSPHGAAQEAAVTEG